MSFYRLDGANRRWLRLFSIRLFSAASLKPLGTLSFHRETVHSLAFGKRAPPHEASSLEDAASTLEIGEDSDDEADGSDDSVPKERWLASGGKDKRIALWVLKDFAGVARCSSGQA